MGFVDDSDAEDYITRHYDAFTKDLMLTIHAPTRAKSDAATQLADSFSWTLSKKQIAKATEYAKKLADLKLEAARSQRRRASGRLKKTRSKEAEAAHKKMTQP